MSKLLRWSNLVSVILPTFQSETYLADTIGGILKQSYPNWELLIVDDASTDGTSTILNYFSKCDSRISVYVLTENLGPAHARNLGIRKSKGRFIAFCDSDDIWFPEKLEKQIEALKKSAAAICFSSYYRVEGDSCATKRLVPAKDILFYDDLLVRNYIGCSTAIYDSYKCGKMLMPLLKKRQDYGLWINILSKGHWALGISEPLVYYRVRKGSVSGNKIKAAFYHWKVLREIAKTPFLLSLRFFLRYAYFGLKRELT